MNVSTATTTPRSARSTCWWRSRAPCNGVAATPAPACIMTGLAPGELQFNVRAWTKDFGDWVQVRTELAMKIRNGLAEAGIEVPKPQREVILRTLPAEEPGKAAGEAPA